MFKIVILNIPDRELGPVIAGLHLPKGVHMEQTHSSDEDNEVIASPAKKTRGKLRKRKRMSHAELLDAKLTMTGKLAVQEKSAVARGLLLFENYEVEVGIGNAGVQGFRDYLKRHRMQKPDLLQKRMVRDEYLDYLG